MQNRYYLDSCIWRDYFENRSDGLRPLGDWALALIKKIIAEDGLIVYSDVVERELKKEYCEDEIASLLCVVPALLLVRVMASKEQVERARNISRQSRVPFGDVLHAIIALDCGAVLVSRDRHFCGLHGITVKKPEELI